MSNDKIKTETTDSMRMIEKIVRMEETQKGSALLLEEKFRNIDEKLKFIGSDIKQIGTQVGDALATGLLNQEKTNQRIDKVEREIDKWKTTIKVLFTIAGIIWTMSVAIVGFLLK